MLSDHSVLTTITWQTEICGLHGKFNVSLLISMVMW